MNQSDGLIPQPQQERLALAVLARCNALSARYGLSLSTADMQMLARNQAEALRATGRIEFGGGPYEALVYAFCDSPYLAPDDYADTLADLCALFYEFKGESAEQWSDDELIAEMKRLYDGPCHGSTELMGDRLWQALHETPEEALEPEQEEPFEE